MDSVSNEVRLTALLLTGQERDNSEGMRYARSCFLDELPGAAFGFITLGYVVMSLISLAW